MNPQLDNLREKLGRVGCDFFFAEYDVQYDEDSGFKDVRATGLFVYQKRPWYSRWRDRHLQQRQIVASICPWMRLRDGGIKMLSFVSLSFEALIGEVRHDLIDRVPGRVDGMMGMSMGKPNLIRKVAESKTEEEWWGNMPYTM